MIAVSGDKILKISVKGSQDGSWGLTQGYKKGCDYHEAIAKWLEMEESDILAKGTDSFLSHHRKVVRKSFCDAHGLKSSSLGHHIKNAFLSWSDASIPLRELFCD